MAAPRGAADAALIGQRKKKAQLSKCRIHR
jgi:hypothetical protein